MPATGGLIQPTAGIVSPVDDTPTTADSINVTVSYKSSLVGLLLLGVSRLELRIDGATVARHNFPKPGGAGQMQFRAVNLRPYKSLPAVQLSVKAWNGPVLLGLASISPSVDLVLDPGVSRLRELEKASTTRPDFEFDGPEAEYVHVNVPVPATLVNDPVRAALHVIAQYREVYSLDDPKRDLIPTRTVEDGSGGKLVHFEQLSNGAPVYGSKLVAQVRDGRFLGSLGHYMADDANPQPDPPSVPPEVAASTAAESTEGGPSEVLDPPELTWFDPSLVGLTGPPTLAWRVSTRPVPNPTAAVSTTGEVLVDATTGTSLLALPRAESHERKSEDFDIERVDDGTDDHDSCYRWDSLDEQYDADQALVDSPTHFATRAWSSLHTVYRYFFDTYGLESWDDDGDDVEVAVEESDLIGNGTAQHSGPFCEMLMFSPGSEAVDTMAHEFTHGIDYHAGSLVYAFESGAADESFADVFAALVGGNWQLYEDDVDLAGIPTGVPKRDVSNPSAFNLPDRYSERLRMCLGSDFPLPAPPTPPPCRSQIDDNGGVHTDSAILAYAAYLATDGGIHPDTDILVRNGIGGTKTGSVWFDTLRGRVGSTFQMIDVRNALVAEARDQLTQGTLTAEDVCSVVNALAAVELGVGDSDCDGIDDGVETDSDADWVPNARDNCDSVVNPRQSDTDGDGRGDACDSDLDGDGALNAVDNCPAVSNSGQQNFDTDASGDACDDSDGDFVLDLVELSRGSDPRDPDTDDDGLLDWQDPVPRFADVDSDGFADPEELERGTDPTDRDSDDDFMLDGSDNCPTVHNFSQADRNELDNGNAADGVGDSCDICPTQTDPGQEDGDGDGFGDTCDPDRDGDGVDNIDDDCEEVYDPHQFDLDGNGVGLACDSFEAGLFDGSTDIDVVTPVRLDAAGRFRLPLPLCRAGCPDVLSDEMRVQVGTSTFGPRMNTFIGDTFGTGGGGKRAVTSALTKFAPTPDMSYKQPTGKRYQGRQYFLEGVVDPQFDGNEMLVHLTIKTAFNGEFPPNSDGDLDPLPWTPDSG